MKITGISESSGTLPINSMPSASGRSSSSRTSPGSSVRIMLDSRGWSPLTTVSKPDSARASRMYRSVCGSSSTTRMHVGSNTSSLLCDSGLTGPRSVDMDSCAVGIVNAMRVPWQIPALSAQIRPAVGLEKPLAYGQTQTRGNDG